MRLETDRLVLREFTARDVPAVLAYQVDPRYLRFYPWTQRTRQDVAEFVQMFISQQKQRPRTKFQLAVELKETRQLIGNCGIRMAFANAHQADIGYELAPEQWGCGYATEAARTMLRFGFTELGVHRIWSWCIAENTGSVRVLEKLGMRLEGRLRDNEYFKGRWWDTLQFAILEHEWRAQSSPV
ncbi:MAG: N-acetyltransferase [Chloroflexi bacterium]|nr:MAG: N-acetyltransferase [Chloroflexota bacterium]